MISFDFCIEHIYKLNQRFKSKSKPFFHDLECHIFKLQKMTYYVFVLKFILIFGTDTCSPCTIKLAYCTCRGKVLAGCKLQQDFLYHQAHSDNLLLYNLELNNLFQLQLLSTLLPYWGSVLHSTVRIRYMRQLSVLQQETKNVELFSR